MGERGGAQLTQQPAVAVQARHVRRETGDVSTRVIRAPSATSSATCSRAMLPIPALPTVSGNE